MRSPDAPSCDCFGDTARRFPKLHRSSFPTHWVTVFGWRRLVGWTPRIRNSSYSVLADVMPRSGFFLGLSVARDDDGEWVVQIGLGVVTIDLTHMTWREPDGD